MKKLSMKVESLRRIPNPYGMFEPETKKKAPEIYMVIVNVNNVPEGISTKTNPRDQNMRTKVARRIRDGLLDSSSNFFLFNRGILISAKDLKFDNVNSELFLMMEDDTIHGIVDGGHTYRTIIENREELDPDNVQFVKVEILTGIEDIFEDLAAARNTSVQVQDKAIAELKKKFNIIKETINTEPFSEDIAYRENEDKSIDVSHIITLLYMFNLDKYEDRDKMPVIAYNSKHSCIKDYIDSYDNNEENNQRNNPYYKMKNVMVDIFKLYDLIEISMADKYREVNKNGKYGSIKGVEISKSGETFESTFYKNPMGYRTPRGFLYPILGSFRALLQEKNGVYEWKVSPFDYFEKLGKDLVIETVDRSRTLGNNPNAVGKDSGHWKQLYQNVLTQYLIDQIS